MLREMSLRRAPSDMVFPPATRTEQLREQLADGQAVLAFHVASPRLFALMVSNQDLAVWEVASPVALRDAIVNLLTELGNRESSGQLELEHVTSDNWKAASRQVFDVLFTGSDVDPTRGIEELIVVPDNFLWYLPFEALVHNDAGETLIGQMRVRYAPTASLSVPVVGVVDEVKSTGVVLGELYPSDDAAIAQLAFLRLQGAVPGARAIPKPLSAPAGLYGLLADRLIVLDAIESTASDSYGFSPIGQSRGDSLRQWMALPWASPRQLLLPGFSTAAESGLRSRSSLTPGDELFFAACGVMATGTRTALVSRWRVGGRSSIDLVQEFVQELPFAPASEAWQRSVQLSSERPLDSQSEPRLARFDVADPPTAAHPLFWAGYMLLDMGDAPQQQDGQAAPADPQPIIRLN
jgi:hypothetical protein